MYVCSATLVKQAGEGAKMLLLLIRKVIITVPTIIPAQVSETLRFTATITVPTIIPAQVTETLRFTATTHPLVD